MVYVKASLNGSAAVEIDIRPDNNLHPVSEVRT